MARERRGRSRGGPAPQKRRQGNKQQSTNGQTSHSGNGTHPNQMEHAEEVIDRVGKRVGQWMHEASIWAITAAARAREEAEDIWADAQNIRRGGSP